MRVFSKKYGEKVCWKCSFNALKKFITWISWLVLNPFWWPKFRLDVIYVFNSHGWKPISIRRSSKMRIYQVFPYRKFVTEVYLRHVRKFITRSIFIGLGSYFYTRLLTHRSTTLLQKSRPDYAPINTSFFEERVRVDTGAQNKFVWAETSKIHN